MSIEQLEALRQYSLKGGELGRLKSALLQKERRLRLIETSKSDGIKVISKLTEREILITGLALYWAEGCRKKSEVQFCNSDPDMIKFFLIWLRKVFGVKEKDIRCRVGINESHYTRDEIVKEYWSKILNIPLSQFNSTSFKRVKNKKVYENFNEHFGTLSVRVVKPGLLYHKIIGMIAALPVAV